MHPGCDITAFYVFSFYEGSIERLQKLQKFNEKLEAPFNEPCVYTSYKSGFVRVYACQTFLQLYKYKLN